MWSVKGEGFRLNAERLDKFDIEEIKNKSDMAYAIAKLTSERMDRLIKQLEKTA